MSTRTKWLSYASFALTLVLPLLMIASIFVVVTQGLGITDFGFVVIEHDVPAPIRERATVWWLAHSASLIFWLMALWKLFGVFRGFAKGYFIDTEAIKGLRGFSMLAVLAVLFAIALSGSIDWTTNASLALNNCLLLSINGEQALLLFMSAIIFVFSGVLLQASTYKKEIEEYV